MVALDNAAVVDILTESEFAFSSLTSLIDYEVVIRVRNRIKIKRSEDRDVQDEVSIADLVVSEVAVEVDRAGQAAVRYVVISVDIDLKSKAS